MAETDHDQVAEHLEHEADDLERHSRELERQAEQTRAEWERKRADSQVPGARPPEPSPEEHAEDEPEQTQTPPW